MLKLLCVVIVSFIVTNASERKAEITWGRILKGKDYPGVNITTNGNKTEITWKQPTNSQINPLRATYAIRFTANMKTTYIELDNLCGEVIKNTFKERVKTFILKTIANTKECPIQKNANTIFEAPLTYSFTSDKNHCGSYRSEFKIFKKSDKGNAQPILTGLFRGNITGCN